MTRIQKIIVSVLGGIVLTFALLFLGVIPGLKRAPVAPPPKTEISFWGFDSDASAWAGVIDLYEARRPNVKVNYKGIGAPDYETVLMDNLAAGEGPDVMLFRHDWMAKHKNKILPAPAATVSPAKIAEIFPKVVSEDFISDNKVYALPASINTLALAYNRDYFDAKQAVLPPSNWTNLRSLIPTLRETLGGKIIKPAIGLGGSDRNVKNGSDILTLMMLQNGVQFFGADSGGRPNFISSGGADILNFYIGFSDPAAKNFAFFSGAAENSLDTFAKGNAGMAFVYPTDLTAIRAKNPTLNIKLAPMLQFNADNPINFADYWGLAAAKQSRNYYLSWDFINFTATDPEAETAYVNASGNAPALRSLISRYQTDPILGVFASQILNAESFPKSNADGFRSVVNNMIESSTSARGSIDRFAREAADKLNSLPAK